MQGATHSTLESSHFSEITPRGKQNEFDIRTILGLFKQTELRFSTLLRVFRIQLNLMKFLNSHIIQTAGRNHALTDTFSIDSPPEILTQKVTVEI